MSKKAVLWGLVVLLAMMLAWPPLFSQVKKKCCIAGTYDITFEDQLSATCKNPRSGKGVMVINQGKKCDAKIWGTVTAEDGTVQDFNGTVSPALKPCCKIKGVVKMRITKDQWTPEPPQEKKEPEQATIEGTLCWKAGKWELDNGTYTTNRGCTGTFTMKQK